ncbi:glyceraldehyde-3-phosphate dehydrogenase [Candidatus Hydrogenisulfobacillus filiaventi]|uniref:Glyceraldehyde-3-phosphate dehydrogenase n=1 Tax=Candidatus Hydrogenisulfobacillus filiaventi TaxID=2707344 RepID=A0A6F8ZJ63_9FIRM|nr:type I glyceraldehyde-3-phosphate dehydrogenase [Bacillota bacterium]CAB1129721.1 glyceraldehyde-3-phosphate dehydrogenase [Candidatus Hydrogenisulfobacillus filiaventi]
MLRVGINGFGSIGRRFFRIAFERRNFEVVAVNDLTDAKVLAHLLKFDSNYGTMAVDVRAEGQEILVGDQRIRVFAERDPARIPWREVGVDVVIESTGFFTSREKAAMHLEAGAKRVIISAPATDVDRTIVMGVNDDRFDPETDFVISNASCTTNCLAPMAKVMDEVFGIESGLMTTVHSYTNDQRLLDQPHKDLRRARAAAQNIIPTSTGAARALHLVLPQLKGKMNGFSVRVPTPVVSLTDLVVHTTRPVSVEAINAAMREAAAGSLKGIMSVCDLPLVSMDFKGDPHSVIIDAASTMVIGDHLAKVVGWYDNEWGYSNRLVELTELVGRRGV